MTQFFEGVIITSIMTVVCDSIPCLAPGGVSQTDSELTMWILTFSIWILMLTFSTILVYRGKGELKDWTLATPFFSGFVGIGTMGVSVILSIFFVPMGEVGRWTENFYEQYASLSVLSYYQPMRFYSPSHLTEILLVLELLFSEQYNFARLCFFYLWEYWSLLVCVHLFLQRLGFLG